MTNSAPNDRGSPESLGQTISKGILGRCPRCGKAPLFAGFLDNAGSCTNCGLDYTFIDAGDGPAVFVILLVGMLILGTAVIVEFTWHPPMWLHALIWVPLVLGLSIGLLRPLKGILIALQYRHKAREGQLDRAP